MHSLHLLTPSSSGGLDTLGRLELPATDHFPAPPPAQFAPAAAPFPPTSHFGPGGSWPVPEPPASFPAEEAATVTSRKPGGGRTLASPGHQAHLLATAHTFCQAQVTPTLTSTSTAPLPPST